MCPSQAVEYATYGGFAWGEVFKARCVVLWGHGPSQSNPTLLYPMILNAQKNGAKLIVVDPHRIPEAEKADMWLPIRPERPFAARKWGAGPIRRFSAASKNERPCLPVLIALSLTL